MRRRKRIEDKVNTEAWAIPYGDLVTLLLAFFVVMYAMSSVNEGKYRILSDVLNAEFRGTPRSPEPIQVGSQQRGASQGDTVLQSRQLLEGLSENKAPPAPVQEGSAPPVSVTPTEDVAGNAQELNRVADDVEQAMSKLIAEKLVAVRRHGLWVEVEIQTDILFPSGVAALSPLAISVLAPLAEAIKPFPNPVRVEGHTDNVPIKTAGFPSNWELSSARAASVVRLFSERGVDPARLTVIGLGEHRPLKSNATAAGRSANRRVVLVILGSDGLPTGTYGHQERES
jgi:chemotaxis protein MotB